MILNQILDIIFDADLDSDIFMELGSNDFNISQVYLQNH